MGLPARDIELVQIVDASLTEAARKAQDWLVCRPGCTQCCHGAFAINALDALRLQSGMQALHATDPALAGGIVKRAHAWVAEHGPQFPGSLDTGVIGDSEDARERFEAFANQAACPALDPATSRCDVYAWRPMTCRVFGPPVEIDAGDGETGALGHCELCFLGATEAEVAACAMPVPHEFESSLLDEVADPRETVVAFALLGSLSGQL